MHLQTLTLKINMRKNLTLFRYAYLHLHLHIWLYDVSMKSLLNAFSNVIFLEAIMYSNKYPITSKESNWKSTREKWERSKIINV